MSDDKDKIGNYDSKVTSERADELDPDSPIIDAELVGDDIPPRPPEPPEPELDPNKCPLCHRDKHLGPSLLKDEFGMICPGEKASKKAQEHYLLLREFAADQAIIDNLDWDSLKADANDAFRGRKRSGVTTAQLQADIDMRLGRLRPKMKLREMLDTDGPDFDIPHVTVPGKVPTPNRSLNVTNIVAARGGIRTQREQAADAAQARGGLIRTAGTPLGDYSPPVNASEVPPEQRGQENDMMMFLKPQKGQP